MRSHKLCRLCCHALVWVYVAAMGGGVCAKGSAPIPPDSTEREKELGKEAAKEIESKYKIVDDKPTVAKLTEMCRVIGQASERPGIQYQVKIVSLTVPNAFTLPGGYIYITQGLLSYAESDHELAGVLAHEIAHNSLLHAIKALAKEKKLQLAQLLAMGIGIASGGSSGVNVAVFAQYVTMAILNGFGVQAEAQADRAAVRYLAKTAYNPVGLLTFLERLARDEGRRPEGPDPGIFRTHPPTPERIEATEKEIIACGLPVNRAAVRALPPIVIEPVPGANVPAVQIKIRNDVICRLTDGPSQTAQQRAEKTVRILKAAMSEGLTTHNIRIQGEASTVSIFARAFRLVDVLPSDAALAGVSLSELATQWLQAFRKIIWEKKINNSL